MGKTDLLRNSIIISLGAIVTLNLLNVFVPETGFDALWYHLTLPKLWLFKKQWYFDGGLLYYSVMPRLTETLFIPLIKYMGTVGPKMLQFLSGIFTMLVVWRICEKLKLSNLCKLLAISLFYCSWLVSWESSSAYIDLFRTFLESVALYNFLFISPVVGSFFLGLAMGTKWLALGSFAIYFFVFGIRNVVPSILLALPWFIVSFYYTSNPVYPILSSVLQHSFLNFNETLKHLLFPSYYLTFPVDDFINPLIGVMFSISVISTFSTNNAIRKISLISILGILSVFFLNPPSARFILPYYPGLVIATIYQLSFFEENIKQLAIFLIGISAVIVLIIRLYAFKKNINYLLGRQTTNQYLESLAYRLPDTFVDTDDYVLRNLGGNKKIIIDKLHNLYYFPYNFDHSSWVSTLSGYDYLVTIGESVDKQNAKFLHQNSLGIQVFELNHEYK